MEKLIFNFEKSITGLIKLGLKKEESKALRFFIKLSLIFGFLLILVEHGWAQTAVNCPTSGYTTVNAYSTNYTLYDNGGPGNNYANNCNGYIFIRGGGTKVISISGTYNMETCCDRIYIYEGEGLGSGTPIQTLGATANGTLSFTGTAGKSYTIRLTSDFSNRASGFVFNVTTTGTSGTLTTVPGNGTSNSVTCGTNVMLQDAQNTTNYSNNQTGFTVLNASGCAAITLIGSYWVEGGSYDVVKIYDGSGISGTLLATYGASVNGLISYTGQGGQTLTVQFTSDVSNVNPGFYITANYSGNCTTPGDPSVFGNNSWNVYGYGAGDATGGSNAWSTSRYYGYYSINAISFDTRTGQTYSTAQSWGDANSPSSASGYAGCSIPVDNHSYIFKRQGFTCGTYQLNLPSHDDMAILLVDGIEVWRNYGCCAFRTAVWTGYLGATSTVELRVSEGGGGSHGALEFVSLSTSASLTGTNPTTCGGNGSIAVSNQQNGHNMTYRSDFSSAPAGSSLTGNAAITGGELRLTSAANYQLGSAVLQPATRANAWTANYSQFIGSGNGADGMSFSYGPISGAANGNSGAGGESGWTSGLVVSFDTHNGATNSQLNIYWNGSIIWFSALNVQNFRTSNYIPVKILVNTSNQLSVTWNSIDLLSNYALPAAYGSANKSTWNYGFSARTGGLNDVHKVSDIYISSIANLEYSINGTTWSSTTPIVAPAGAYTVQARPAVGLACPATIGTITLTNPNTIDWANLQFPSSASICSNASTTVYGRVYKAGYTDVAGADANMTVQVGINSTNTNPNTWAAGAWSNATYNVQSGNDDEYQAIFSGLAVGTYYYTFRYRYCTDGAWYYGGYNAGGGGFYNGTTNVNGVLTVNALPMVSAISTLPSVCAGSSVTLTGGGANSYSWNNGVTNGVSFAPASTATYTVTGTSAAGCTNTANVSVTVNALPTVSASASSVSVCAGASTTLTGGGASTYSWNNGISNGVSFIPVSTGAYTVTGTSGFGCTNTASITITVNALPSVTASASSTTSCAGTPVTLTGGGANTYSWNNGVTNSVAFTPASSGSYTVTGTDAIGCTNTASLVLTVNTLPTLSASASPSTVCAGLASSLSVSGASTYSWDNGAGSGSTVSVNPASTTTYTVTGTDANGCVNSATTFVTVGTLSLNTTVNTGDYVWIGNASSVWTNASNWMVYNGSSYTVATALPSISNNVIIRSNNACVLSQPASISGAFGEANNVVIESGGSLGIQASETLNVHGNWTNNGTFTPGTGAVAFVGTSGNQTITKTGGETFAYVTVNKSSGNVVLANNTAVTGGLTLTNGKVELGTNNLTMGGATLTGGSSSSYVKTASTGVLKRNIGTSGAVFFPVGNSAYNPAELTNTIDSDVFSLRVVDAVYVNGTSGTVQSTSVVNRTWMIGEETQGGNSVKMKLYWNGVGEEATDFTANQAFIAHYVSSALMWDNMGGTQTASGYVESIQATTTFSPFTISSTTTFAPLPVELMTLDAQCAGENVIVSWKTASEHNSLNFVVERSEDGFAWSEIQTVAAAGNSNSIIEYAIEDAGAARGVKYYRLIQVDQDGAQKVYGPVISNCGSDDNLFMSFPNPSDAEITLVFNDNTFTGPSTLSVRDAHGRVVRSIALEIQPGTSSILIPDMELEPAVYYLQLEGDNFKSPVLKHSLR